MVCASATTFNALISAPPSRWLVPTSELEAELRAVEREEVGRLQVQQRLDEQDKSLPQYDPLNPK